MTDDVIIIPDINPTILPPEDTQPVPVKPPPAKPRINIIEQVFWQGPEAKPILSETRIGFMVECEEEPYQRSNVRIGLQWERIDLGWMAEKPISQIVIINPGKPTDPTLEIGIRVPNHQWLIDYTRIKPGHSHRIDPTQSPPTYYIRSRDNKAKYSIRVFPA